MSDKKASKFLSRVLRHEPELIGLGLDSAGWATVADVLAKAPAKFDLTRKKLEEIVSTNDKQRFEFSQDGRKIRARQGHSLDVALDYDPREPPEHLCHGTSQQFVSAIRKEGLLKMSRHAVHLSPDPETARNVGSRRGKPVIILVQAKMMHEQGYKFYLTGNNVWYTEHVPPEFLLWPDQNPRIIEDLSFDLDTPKWKVAYNLAIKEAEKNASEARCEKTKLLKIYLGSFAEQYEPFRCLLDKEHEGACCFREDLRKGHG